MPGHANAIDHLESLVARLEQATASIPEFATVTEASRILGVGIKALRGAIHRGDIPVYTLGTKSAGRTRVHVPEARAWALSTARDPLAGIRSAGNAAARDTLHRSITRDTRTK